MKKNKKILKKTCKILKLILKSKLSGEKWHEVVTKWNEVKKC